MKRFCILLSAFIIISMVNVFAYINPYTLPPNHSNSYIMLECDLNNSGLYDTLIFIDLINYDNNNKVIFDKTNNVLYGETSMLFSYYDYSNSKWQHLYLSDYLYVENIDRNSIFTTISIYDENYNLFYSYNPFIEQEYNILDKPLNKYTTTESLLFILILIQFTYFFRTIFRMKGVY